jgi:hypothetical protein
VSEYAFSEVDAASRARLAELAAASDPGTIEHLARRRDGGVALRGGGRRGWNYCGLAARPGRPDGPASRSTIPPWSPGRTPHHVAVVHLGCAERSG